MGKGAQMGGSTPRRTSVKANTNVCETDLDVSPFQMLCNAAFMAPTGLSFMSSMKETRRSRVYLLPGLAVYLFEHIKLHSSKRSASKHPGHEISLQSCHWLLPFDGS